MVAHTQEPNDTIPTAINTGLSSANLGPFTLTTDLGNNPNVVPGLDVDFFQVQLGAGDQLLVDIDAVILGSFFDSALRLFDAAGNQLAFVDDFPAPGELFTLDPFLNFTATTAGTYYIGFSGLSNSNYDPFIEGSGFFPSGTGSYTIEITIAPPNEINGTSDDDFLIGTPLVDIISGDDGDDTILGLAGNDQLFGGSGDDLITGGDGDDNIEGGSGADQLNGGFGNDTILGNDGLDIIFGGDSNDQIFAGRGNDRVFGEFGDDLINGDDGNDIIDAGFGFDTVSGGNGSDRIFGGFDSDSIFGDAGSDQLNGDSGSDFLDGGSGNDFLFGGTEFDTLIGGVGRDTLRGGLESDFLDGGDGNDLLIGVDPRNPGFFGPGFGAFEIDTLTGGAGRDTFVLGDDDRVFYDDGNPASSGDFDYALITDFNVNQDFIQLNGSANSYSLDFFTSVTGTIDAALIFDGGTLARDEVIGVLQNVSLDLSLSSPNFRFV
jgi:serralysin